MQDDYQYSPIFKKALDSLQGKKVIIFGHTRADGDCIGSQVALCRCLNALGVETITVSPDPVPRILQPFVRDTPLFQEHTFTAPENPQVILVDCSDPQRIGENLSQHFPDVFLNIDHHITNSNFARHNIVDTSASSTAEILARIFLENNLPIDPATAQALYIGIATDTGQFRFPNTGIHTFSLVADLIKRGANPGQAAYHLYESVSLPRILLLKEFLNSFKLELDNKVCIGLLTHDMFRKTGAKHEDREGFVDYARSIEGVQIGILLEELDGEIKGSFRAKDPKLALHKLAQQFNGGGHPCAAAFKVPGHLNEFYPQLLNTIRSHLDKLNLS